MYKRVGGYLLGRLEGDKRRLDLAVVVNTVLVSHFGVGEFTTPLISYFRGWMGLFAVCTIWVLTHGHGLRLTRGPRR